MKSAFIDSIRFERIQAAVKIQRAWRACLTDWRIQAHTCPYCYMYGCGGIYSEFNCREMWEEADLIKLDREIDRFNN
jgi:hypothetical protein